MIRKSLHIRFGCNFSAGVTYSDDRRGSVAYGIAWHVCCRLVAAAVMYRKHIVQTHYDVVHVRIFLPSILRQNANLPTATYHPSSLNRLSISLNEQVSIAHNQTLRHNIANWTSRTVCLCATAIDVLRISESDIRWKGIPFTSQEHSHHEWSVTPSTSIAMQFIIITLTSRRK